MSFGPVDSQVDLVSLEERALARWRETSLFETAQRRRAGAPPWVFYEGPPTTNGRPGLHHVWARAFKDLFPRFQTMRGRYVPRKGGWDCHGLPVEIEVEKELGFTQKHQIEDYGIDRFNARCRESVERYVGDWAALTERAAVWIDTDQAYWTLSNDYIESVWWLVKQLDDRDLLYEGHRVTPYCPRCGTALSSHELGQPGAYREITDASAYVRFPLVGGGPGGEADLLVWTTTPWTLVSNVAAAVGPDIEYVRVPSPTGRELVLAAERADALLGEGCAAAAVERLLGADLVGRRYRRPFDLLPLDERAERVVAADFVSTEEGTGIVHLAPAFGADDMEVARAEALPVLNPVDARGAFDERVPPWHGRQVKETDPEVIAHLDREGILFREEPYVHAYPHCWRCGTPLLYWAKTSWFVRTSERKRDLIAQNEVVNWYPEHIKHGRFGDWLENNVDWALSRDRYWGTPLPIWRCPAAHDTVVGSVAELSGLAGHDLVDLDLHRPYVDEVTIPCPSPGCSEVASRLPPVLDAWFDSGSMPSAQHHYPFADRDLFEATFPADFICEAIDQTRGWFYSLLAVNTLTFGSTPYRNVLSLAHIVDQHGQKMSKSKGNVIDPWEVIESNGSDALRWYFFSAGSPWTSRRVYEEGIQEAARKTLITLWNVFSFFATYADIDGWDPPAGAAAGAAPESGHVLDRWVMSRLSRTVDAVTFHLEGFDALAAATALATFVDDLSNWYVRRSRPRFWRTPGSGDGEGNEGGAHATLYRSLVVTSQLLAPFCPFLADEIHVTLTRHQSVHLTDWPEPPGPPDADVEEQMDAARRLVGLGRAARADASVRVRQPLRRALLLHPGVDLGEEARREVADELNVKALEDVETLSQLMSWSVIPNFRTLGPRLGARVNDVKRALAEADGSAVRRALELDGHVTVAGERLGPADVEVRAHGHEDFALSQEGGWAVALDLDVDEVLKVEGTARQLVRDLNDLRKQLGLALTDRVTVRIHDTGPRVRAAVEAHRPWIASETLAEELAIGVDGAAGTDQDGHDLDVDGEPTRVHLRVVS